MHSSLEVIKVSVPNRPHCGCKCRYARRLTPRGRTNRDYGEPILRWASDSPLSFSGELMRRYAMDREPWLHKFGHNTAEWFL